MEKFNSLAEAIDRLEHQDAYKYMVAQIRELSESLIDESVEVPADKLQMHVGRIATYREMLAILER